MANILIVDDQECVRELISEELILEGHKVQTVGDAQSVMECLMFTRPDLVLLDLYLEGPEGFGLLDDIKRQHPHLPVIILTAYDTYRDDPRLSQANGYVIKRVRVCDELKQKIDSVLRGKPVPIERTRGEKASRHLTEAKLVESGKLACQSSCS